MSGRDWSLRSGERQVAPTLSTVRPDHVERYRHALAEVLLTLGRRPRTVLDLFCGVGYGTRFLADATGAAVDGVDGSAEAIAYGRVNHQGGGARFLHAAWPPLGVEGPYDAVVALEAVEHVDDAAALLRDLAAVLRPGGCLVLSTPNGTVVPLHAEGWPFHRFHATPHELAALLAGAGLLVARAWCWQAADGSIGSDAAREAAGRFQVVTVTRPR